MARCRPLFAEEKANREYNVMSMEKDSRLCLLHDARLDREHKTYTYFREFALDGLFTAEDDCATVFDNTVAPLLGTVVSGGRATFVAFGQTGTGKTFTVHSIQNQLAQVLFQGGIQVSVVAFEMRGKNKCSDLLNDRKQVKLLQGGDGNIAVRGARQVQCSVPEDLNEVFAAAHALRSVAATERNAQSSRSHAICQITILPRAAGAEEGQGGILTLVDLAGSERNEDQGSHTAVSQREAAEINGSLSCLKDCFRALTEKDVEQEIVVEKKNLNTGETIYQDKMDEDATTGIVERMIIRDKKVRGSA